MALDFFYDEQIRRYLLQFVRIFNQFQYKSGKDASGNAILRTIPATFASMDRQVASIIQNNSENVLLSTPQISCWISSLKRSPERMQDPNYVRSINVFERDVDESTKRFTSQVGNIYNIESYMPVPYDLFMQTDIWTSNELQKQQILEQILVLFNPAIDLQTGDNPFDWTSLTIVELQDITWSSRSYPAGTSDNIDIASLTFKIPIWLNAPSKVKRQSIIQQIVIDIGQIEDIKADNGQGYYFAGSDLISRLIITPGDFSVSVSGNEVTLLNPDNCVRDTNGNPMTWVSLLQKYGKFRNGVSQIRLKKSGSDIETSITDVIGTLQLDPNNESKLSWTIDIQTLPTNTLPAINAVIDPVEAYPSQSLVNPAPGQRYLLLSDLPTGAIWGSASAKESDIIEYGTGQSGPAWIVVFDASQQSHTTEYVVNSHNGQQLYWDGHQWLLSIDGIYSPGYWRLAL